VAGVHCLVVGGGPVGARRAKELAAAGASVTVVAPDLDPSLAGPGTGAASGGGTLECLARPYQPGEATSYQLVVTATGDPATDRAVVADALGAGVLVSSADAANPGNVSLPAVFREGAVTVAVSTGGTSPALAVWLRDLVGAALGPGLAMLAELAGEAREALRRSGAAPDRVDWQAAFDEAAPLVANGRVDEARALLLARCAGTRRGQRQPGGADGDSVGSAG
jgi:siroheme synthase-like protein